MPVGEFRKDPTAKQYVYVQAQFEGRLLEKVVLVSFQSGYIFIQTDKTLYTPNSKGECKAKQEQISDMLGVLKLSFTTLDSWNVEYLK